MDTQEISSRIKKYVSKMKVMMVSDQWRATGDEAIALQNVLLDGWLQFHPPESRDMLQAVLVRLPQRSFDGRKDAIEDVFSDPASEGGAEKINKVVQELTVLAAAKVQTPTQGALSLNGPKPKSDPAGGGRATAGGLAVPSSLRSLIDVTLNAAAGNQELSARAALQTLRAEKKKSVKEIAFECHIGDGALSRWLSKGDGLPKNGLTKVLEYLRRLRDGHAGNDAKANEKKQNKSPPAAADGYAKQSPNVGPATVSKGPSPRSQASAFTSKGTGQDPKRKREDDSVVALRKRAFMGAVYSVEMPDESSDSSEIMFCTESSDEDPDTSPCEPTKDVQYGDSSNDASAMKHLRTLNVEEMNIQQIREEANRIIELCSLSPTKIARLYGKNHGVFCAFLSGDRDNSSGLQLTKQFLQELGSTVRFDDVRKTQSTLHAPRIKPRPTSKSASRVLGEARNKPKPQKEKVPQVSPLPVFDAKAEIKRRNVEMFVALMSEFDPIFETVASTSDDPDERASLVLGMVDFEQDFTRLAAFFAKFVPFVGLCQKKIAEAFGVSGSLVSQVMHGKSKSRTVIEKAVQLMINLR